MTKTEAIETLQKIRTAAEAALTDGVNAICVTVARAKPPARSHVYLCEHSGPLGTVLNAKQETAGWIVTARFQAAAVACFCSKQIERILRQ
jgi:hypothetical protein